MLVVPYICSAMYVLCTDRIVILGPETCLLERTMVKNACAACYTEDIPNRRVGTDIDPKDAGDYLAQQITNLMQVCVL